MRRGGCENSCVLGTLGNQREDTGTIEKATVPKRRRQTGPHGLSSLHGWRGRKQGNDYSKSCSRRNPDPLPIHCKPTKIG